MPTKSSQCARKGRLTIRSGKRDSYREVPLNAEARQALDDWLLTRSTRLKNPDEPALFIARDGSRRSSRSVEEIISRLGDDAGIDLSPHVLRHTCLTALVRSGNDLVLVADVAGHKRLETTRRYSLPSEADRAAAMEAVSIDY